jgi:N-acetylneuraminate synthase
MTKLNKVLLSGHERDVALAAIHKQLDAWGIRMPNVEPLPLHFGLNKFFETGETEFWIANETEHGYCGKFLFVFDGQTCPYHSHKIKHETFFVLKGSVRMKVNNDEKILNEGDVLIMPINTGHSFTGIGPALILETSMPSVPEDSHFSNKEIGNDGVL